MLAFLILTAVTRLIDGAVIAPLLGFDRFAENAGQPLLLIVSLALLLPGLAVAVRRFHDIGRSGLWLLIVLVPVIGTIILIYWNVQPSEDGQNQYG